MASEARIAFTVRLPSGLYRASAQTAKRRRVSLNALVQEGLAALLKKEEYARLYEAFGQVGDEIAECDVEYAAPAQWEVISGGDR